jgi:hypothetical protein
MWKRKYFGLGWGSEQGLRYRERKTLTGVVGSNLSVWFFSYNTISYKSARGIF